MLCARFGERPVGRVHALLVLALGSRHESVHAAWGCGNERLQLWGLLGLRERPGGKAQLCRSDLEPTEIEWFGLGSIEEIRKRSKFALNLTRPTRRVRLAAFDVMRQIPLLGRCSLAAVGCRDSLHSTYFGVDRAKLLLIDGVLSATVAAAKLNCTAPDRRTVDSAGLTAAPTADDPDVVLARTTTEPTDPGRRLASSAASRTAHSNHLPHASFRWNVTPFVFVDLFDCLRTQPRERLRQLKRIRKIQPDPKVPGAPRSVASAVRAGRALNNRQADDAIKNRRIFSCDRSR
jgi:hypothetical protein